MNEDQLALLGALRLVDLRQILDVFLEQTHAGLRGLTDGSTARSDADRKRALLLFLHSTRQRLLRILVIAKWTNKARVVAEVGRLLDVAARQAGACREAADQLAFLHAELEDARAPAYDVHTALHVLQTGGYDLLPACIEELRPPAVPPPAKRRAALRLMDQILRTTLLQVGLPAGVAVVGVGGGAATLRCGGLWEARLTLVPAPPLPSAPPAPAGSDGQPDLAAGQHGQTAGQPEKPEQAPEGLHAAAAGAGQPRQHGQQQAAQGADAAQDAAGPSHAADPPAPPASSAVAGGVLGQRWRWRLLSMAVLPDYGTRDALLAPAQALQLRGAVEMRMWAASEAQEQAAAAQPVLASRAHASDGSLAQEPAGGKPGSSLLLQQQATGIAKEEPGGAPEAAPAAPLEVLQGILLDVSARLALNQAVSSARAAAAQGSGRWAGQLRLDRATARPVGVRLCYWLGVPTVSCAELPRLASPEGVPSAGAGAGAGADHRVPHAHTPPAVEICIAQEGHLMVASDPPLARPAAALNNGKARAGDEAACCVHLALDLADLDAERVLLQAASANAAIQLAALDTVLRRRGNLANNAGSTALLLPEPGTVQREEREPTDSPAGSSHKPRQPALDMHAPPASPVLALRSGGAALVQVSVQLKTGRLLLRPGDDAELRPDLELIVQRDEDKLAAIRADALKAATLQPGLVAAEGIAKALEMLWATLSMRGRCTQLKDAGRALGLAPAQLPPVLYKAYLAAGGAVQVPGKTVQYLAFPAARFPSPPAGGSSGEAWREHTERVLGRRAVGVRFLLGAEICTGMRWRFLLLAVACNSSNLPVQILRAWPVPRDRRPKVPVQHHVTGSAVHPEASAREHTVGAAGKQSGSQEATLNGTTRPVERRAAAGAGSGGEGLGEGRGATEGFAGASWGREHAGELEEVVRWCAPKVAWEHLRLQLNVMGVGYTEEVALDHASPEPAKSEPQDTGGHGLPNGHARHSSEEEEDTHHRPKRARLSAGDSAGAGHLHETDENGEESLPEAAAPPHGRAAPLPSPPALQRVLQLHGLHSLQLLDELPGVGGQAPKEAAQRPSAQLWADVLPGAGQGAVGGALRSAYLGGLPGSCAGCPGRAASSAEDARRLTQTPSGVALNYRSSAGDTAATLVEDVRRLTRLHLALARMAACMRASAAHPPKAASSAQHAREAAAGPAVPAAGLPAPGAKQQSSQPALGPGSMAPASPTPPLANGGAAGHPAVEEGVGDRGHAPAAQGGAGGASSSGGGPPPPLHWQAAEGSGLVRLAAVGLTRAVLTVVAPGGSSAGATPADMQQPPGEGLQNPGEAPSRAGGGAHACSGAPAEHADLSVSMEWACTSGDAAGAACRGLPAEAAPERGAGAGGNAGALRCRLRAEPALPAAVLRALEDMADCGEEELLLDALSVCGGALVCLGSLLAPPALLDLGLLPEEVSLEARRPPYLLRLTLHKGTAAEVALGLHMLAGNLVWLVPRTAQPGVRQQIMDHLCRLSDVLLPESESDPSAAPKLPQVSKDQRQQAALPLLEAAMDIDQGGAQAGEDGDKTFAGSGPSLGMGTTTSGLWVKLSALSSAAKVVLAIAAESIDAL